MDTAWGTPPWMDQPQYECSAAVCYRTNFEYAFTWNGGGEEGVVHATLFFHGPSRCKKV